MITVGKSNPPTFLKASLSCVFSSTVRQDLIYEPASHRTPAAHIWLPSCGAKGEISPVNLRDSYFKGHRMVKCLFLQLTARPRPSPPSIFYFSSWRTNLILERKCPGAYTKPCSMKQVCGWTDYFLFLGLSFYFILFCVSCFGLLWGFSFLLQKKNRLSWTCLYI